MPISELLDESELSEDAFILQAIISNSNSPVAIIEEMSTISEAVRGWEDEDAVEVLRETALELLAD